MINKDRIVPVTAIDLLTLYATTLKISGEDIEAFSTENPGEFEVDTATTDLFANEPVESLNFDTAVTSAVVYFVPAHDYSGFSIAGTAVATTGTIVNPDGRTLYKATLASAAVTIEQISF